MRWAAATGRGGGAGWPFALIAIVLASVGPPPLVATDWPHRRGPDGDLHHPQPVPDGTRAWSLAWQGTVGVGACSVVVADGLALTIGNHRHRDTVTAFAADTGAVRWRARYPARREAKFYDGGPNATPTIADGRVYTLSKQGLLSCFALADGALQWRRDLVVEEGIAQPNYGFSSSPLLVDALVVLNIGSHGLAVNAADGRTRWRSGDRADGYASPARLADGGLVFHTRAGISAADRDGTGRWAVAWPVKHAIVDPVILPDGVLVSHGYGTGSLALTLTGDGPEDNYRTSELACTWSTPVVVGDHLYALHGSKEEAGDLRCLRWRDGHVTWRSPTVSQGALIAVGAAAPVLLVLDRDGWLHCIAADPHRYRELSRQRIFTERCWATPAWTGSRLYLRDAAGTVRCLVPDAG